MISLRSPLGILIVWSALCVAAAAAGIMALDACGWLAALLAASAGLAVFAPSIYLLSRQARQTSALDEELRALMRTVPDGLLVLSPEERIVCANEPAGRLFGFPGHELVGRRIGDFLPEGIRELLADAAQVRAKQCRVDELTPADLDLVREVVGQHRQGEELALEAHLRPVAQESGPGYALLLRDLTERRRAEEAVRQTEESLRQAEAKFRSIFEHAAEGIFQATPQGRFITANPALARMLGYSSPQELMGAISDTKRQLFVDPNKRSQIRQLSERTGRVRGFEVQAYRKDGSKIWLMGNQRVVHDADGRVLYYEGNFEDITERKRAEEDLRQSEERFRQLAENIRGVFWMTDPDMRELFYVNRAYEEIWGRTRDSLFKAPLSRLEAVDDKDRARVLAAIHQAAAGHYDEEYSIVRHDGQVRWIWDRAFPILDGQGRVCRLAGIAEDITDRKRLAEEFRQAQKMEAVGRLAGGIAHDFNNLLTVVIGYCQVLQAALKDPQWQPCLAEMKKAADRAASLTQQLLAFSRKQVLLPVVLDLNGLVAGMKDMIGRLVGEDVELVTALDSALGRVQADPGHLQQILMNLIVNARDAMPGGGRLTIRTANMNLSAADLRGDPEARPGAYAMVSVSDTGCGMSEEIQARLFEPFFTTKEVGKGTGLGLSMVYGIVKQSKGHVEVESAPGKGSSFRIYLPCVSSPAAKVPAAPSTPAAVRGQETVLLVEDEEMVRRLTRTILQRSGYTVLEARNGKQALQVAEQQPGDIDLLVTDVVMPEMNGHQLYQRLTSLRPGLKVLFMSGYTDSALFRNGVLENGFTLVLKPFAPEALLHHVREMLDNPV